MSKLEVVCEGGWDDWFNYRIDGQNDYENFEVQFEKGEFNGIILGYKNDTLWENIATSSPYYKLLKEQAIIDYI